MELLFLLGLAVILFVILGKKNPLNEIPGPKALPLAGNMLQLDTDKLYIRLKEFTRQYGSIYKMHIFTKPVVVVNDAESIHEVLVKRSAEFAGRPDTFRNKLLTKKFEVVSYVDLTDEEKARRKAIQSYLKQFGTGIQKIEEVTLIATDDLIKRLDEQNGRPINIRDFLFHCVTDVMMIFIRGEPMSNDEIKILKDFSDILNEITSAGSGMLLDIFPFVRFFGNKTYGQFMQAHQYKHKLVSGWMESRPTEGFINFVQSMSEQELKNNALDTEAAQQNSVWAILLGGVSTTSTTLTSLINVLCHYPDVQEKLRKEVMDVIGSSRSPSLKDRDDLPYLRATILELGRFASIAPLTIPHKALQTSSIGKYTVPKDTEVWINLWAMHHDEKLWDEPFAFKPERFLNADGKLVPADHPNRKNTMPFGAGHRVCIGEVFANSRMFLITARILQNFTILPESTMEKQPSCDPRNMTMGLLLYAPPYKVRLVPLSEE